MLLVAVVLAVTGIALFVGAPLLARVFLGRERDKVALTRIIQGVGVVLLIGALVVAPYNPDNTAVPPPPDMPDPRVR